MGILLFILLFYIAYKVRKIDKAVRGDSGFLNAVFDKLGYYIAKNKASANTSDAEKVNEAQ